MRRVAASLPGPVYFDADHLDWSVFGLPKAGAPFDAAWLAGVDRYADTLAEACEAIRAVNPHPVILYGRTGVARMPYRNLVKPWLVTQFTMPAALLEWRLRMHQRLAASFDVLAWDNYWSLLAGNVALHTDATEPEAYRAVLDYQIAEASTWGKPMIVFTFDDEPPEIREIIDTETRVKWALFK